MNMILRIVLYIFYSLIALGIIWLFAAGGHGTFVPIAIFGSWAVVLARMVWPTLIGFISFYLLYYLGLILLTSCLSSRRTNRHVLIPLVFHANRRDCGSF